MKISTNMRHAAKCQRPLRVQKQRLRNDSLLARNGLLNVSVKHHSGFKQRKIASGKGSGLVSLLYLRSFNVLGCLSGSEI